MPCDLRSAAPADGGRTGAAQPAGRRAARSLQHLWRNLRQQNPGEMPMTRSRAVSLTALAAIVIACAAGAASAWSAPSGAPHPAADMSVSGLTGWIFAEQAAF